MREIVTVFGFTFRDGIRKRAFIISTCIILGLLVIASLVVRLISDGGGDTSSPSGNDEVTASKTMYVVDDGGIFEDAAALLTADPSLTDTEFKLGTVTALETYTGQIEGDGNISAVVIKKGDIGDGVERLQFTFYVQGFMTFIASDQVTSDLRSAYTTGLLEARGAADVAAQVTAEPVTSQEIVGGQNLGGYIVGILLIVLMFFSVYYYGYFVAMSVAAEKTSRVMETLVVSAKPSRILLGKVAAMGVLGLLQMVSFLVVGALCYRFVLPEGFAPGGMSLDLSVFTVPSALLVLIYFILGFTLFAMINSVCGATVSRAEDVNTALMPASMIAVISWFASYMIGIMPSSEAAKRIATYIPFTSPFITPYRLLSENLPAADILISLGLLLAAIALVSFLSMRLYTASVLHYGQRLRLKDLFNLKT